MQLLHRANENLVYLTCGNDNLSLGRAYAESHGVALVDHYGFIVDSVEELDARAHCSRATIYRALREQPSEGAAPSASTRA